MCSEIVENGWKMGQKKVVKIKSKKTQSKPLYKVSFGFTAIGLFSNDPDYAPDYCSAQGKKKDYGNEKDQAFGNEIGHIFFLAVGVFSSEAK